MFKLKRKVEKLLLRILPDKYRIEIYRRGGVKIGKHCEIYKTVSFGSEPWLITIGDYVRITSGVKFCTHDGGMWVIRNAGYDNNADVFGKIIIGNNVHIGWNSIIMPGVTIGNNVVVGVNSVVTKDIPDNCVVAGCPAKVIRSLDSYYEKNKPVIIDTKGVNVKRKELILEKLEQRENERL